MIIARDIIKNFPIKGNYILRYRHEFEKKKFAWLDLNLDSTCLPYIEGKIFVKASRLNWEENCF